MELKEFIRESLVQIARGIEESNSQLADSKASVNPPSVKVYSKEAKAYGRVSTQMVDSAALVEFVEFDVAVTADSGSETGGGLKVSIASIGAGAEGKSSTSQSSASRIKFGIPMVYPTGNEP
ncbi:MAG: hypothetical protein VX549_08920 [Pseudomonadota bacterium]|nr:hypothetical protein [Pseudomonadota bacterium]